MTNYIGVDLSFAKTGVAVIEVKRLRKVSVKH